MPALVSPQADALLDAERALLDRLAALLAAADADPATAARLAEVAANLSDLFLVVVVGEFNAGKSTVLNALFGEVVMEEGPVPTTDKITVLRHGDAPETHHRSPFVTERRLPAPFLQGLTLVDTPGTNSIIQEHQALTEDFVPRADLVVFVTSFDRPLSDSERTFLGFIRDTWGKQLVFVLNKADLADDANEDPDAALAQVLAHVREGTERLMGFTPKIFPVAARLALKAKLDETTVLADDPRWEASRFAAFESYLTDTLTDAHRYALKLHAPLDAARQLFGHAEQRLAERRTIVDDDAAGLDRLHERFAQKETALATTTEQALTAIDNELLELEQRGRQFLDDSIRVSKIRMLRDRDRFKTEFQQQVLRDAETRIETRMGEAVDALLRTVLDLWNDTYTHLADQKRRHEGTAARQDGAFLYNRDEVFTAVAREARRTLDGTDLQEEARRILENARSAATLFAGGLGTAAGIGILVTAIATTAAFDVTGGLLAALAIGALGFLVLPREKRKAIREFKEQVGRLRENLRDALRQTFDEETDDALARVRTLVRPVETLVAEERAKLTAAESELETLRADAKDLRARVTKAFGTAEI
ncbi:MAG: dynamin family protein [Bacteroidota bacterium]